MRRVLLLLSTCLVVSLVLAPPAGAQQGPACPTNQVNVLLENGEFICVPGGSAERTPAQDEAVANDPRSNAETPLIEKPRNCDEFYGSQASAQEFLENVTPDDRFNLDPDNDGVACEGLLPNGQEGPGAENQEFTPEWAAICDGLFPANPPGGPEIPGEGPLECFETAEQAKAFSETGQIDFPGNENDVGVAKECLPGEGCGVDQAASGEQYAEDTGDTSETSDTTEITTLPDTGGLPLGAIGAGAVLFFVAGGMLLKYRLI